MVEKMTFLALKGKNRQFRRKKNNYFTRLTEFIATFAEVMIYMIIKSTGNR